MAIFSKSKNKKTRQGQSTNTKFGLKGKNVGIRKSLIEAKVNNYFLMGP